jgi:hypothetical protein
MPSAASANEPNDQLPVTLMSQPSSFKLLSAFPASSPLELKMISVSGAPRRSARSCGVMSVARY